jgi:hypothetical protein
MCRSLRVTALLVFVLVLAASAPLRAQGGGLDVYPTELYSGDNVITIKHPDGIRRIAIVSATPNLSIEGDGTLDCETSHDLHVYRATAHDAAMLRLLIVDCRGGRQEITLRDNTTWVLEIRNFGAVPTGERECMMFYIRSNRESEAETLDSVSVADPHVSLRFFTTLPHSIRVGSTYQYEVCFRGTDPGFYKFPVVTWMRRGQPSGGMTTYAVADTGIVYVVLPPEPPPVPVADPTTFRTIAVPNAVIPPKGRAVVGVYDVLGVLAGYSITDNIMILGGGAIPLPDDWAGVRGQMFGAASIGVKAGVALGDRWNIAAGYQFAKSIYDEEATPGVTESAITVNAPWGAISYGDDDSRASLTFGYALKHHVKPLIEFDENAAIVAAGADYRFAHNWKVAAEVAYMQTLGVIPIVATARYFTDSYAIDAGLGFAGITVGDGDRPAVPVLPVISAVFVF